MDHKDVFLQFSEAFEGIKTIVVLIDWIEGFVYLVFEYFLTLQGVCSFEQLLNQVNVLQRLLFQLFDYSVLDDRHHSEKEGEGKNLLIELYFCG